MMRSGTLVDATAANVHAVTAAAGLLRKDDGVVYRDSACLGTEKRDGIRNSPPLSAITYRINRRPGRLPRASDNATDWERSIENPKIICALQGGTPLPNREEHLRFPKGRLQGTEKEPEPLTRTFRQGESVYACQGGRLPMPRPGFLCPSTGLGLEKRGIHPPIWSFIGRFHLLRLFAWLLPALICALKWLGADGGAPANKRRTQLVQAGRHHYLKIFFYLSEFCLFQQISFTLLAMLSISGHMAPPSGNTFKSVLHLPGADINGKFSLMGKPQERGGEKPPRSCS